MKNVLIFRILFTGLCLLGGIILLFPAYHFSAWVTFGAAAIVLCYRLLWHLSHSFPVLSGILQRCLTAGLCLVVLACAVAGFFIVRAAGGQSTAPCDYLIVLGAGVNGSVPSLTLRERLDAAHSYLSEHPNTICIVSGGQGDGEDITEAECMYRYLTGMGIPPERILKESNATSTWENLTHSTALIESHCGNRPRQVGIVSSDYHLYRAGQMAKAQLLEPILIPAKTGRLSLRINYFLREIAGVWYYWLFGSFG